MRSGLEETPIILTFHPISRRPDAEGIDGVSHISSIVPTDQGLAWNVTADGARSLVVASKEAMKKRNHGESSPSFVPALIPNAHFDSMTKSTKPHAPPSSSSSPNAAAFVPADPTENPINPYKKCRKLRML